jgi:hypothetical protein
MAGCDCYVPLPGLQKPTCLIATSIPQFSNNMTGAARLHQCTATALFLRPRQNHSVQISIAMTIRTQSTRMQQSGANGKGLTMDSDGIGEG